METKKNRPINTTVTRDTARFSDMKRELHRKIEEFSAGIDTMDEIYENREQIEVVRHYEQMPKPTLQATQEYLDGEIYYRNPAKEDQNMQRLEAMENEAIAESAVAEKQ